MRVEQRVGSETAPSEPPEGALGRRSPERFAPALAVAAVAAVSLVRILTNGFDLVAADDAAYIRIGRELWRLHEPLFVDGSVFTIRSWVFPLLTGGASLLGGTDPFMGSRILCWLFATTALALATVVAARIAVGGRRSPRRSCCRDASGLVDRPDHADRHRLGVLRRRPASRDRHADAATRGRGRDRRRADAPREGDVGAARAPPGRVPGGAPAGRVVEVSRGATSARSSSP